MYSVAVGRVAGQSDQGQQAVAIGYQAGRTKQSINAIAIGQNAGSRTQGEGSIGIGYQSGNWVQQSFSTAIGYNSGFTNQGSYAIAIGYNAGQNTQGAYAIAIGNLAGQTNQPASSIVINASSLAITVTTQAGFYAQPVRKASLGTNYYLMMYDSTKSEIIRSEIVCGNTKTFVIDHPNDKNKYLIHACLEGPEGGVYYRGKSEIINNSSVTIELPDYVKNLATEFTIQITPIYSGKELDRQLYASEVENNCFKVYGPNTKFYWHVHGKRCSIDVEPLKSSVDVKGQGPYRWI